jgi:hypothetical protein
VGRKEEQEAGILIRKEWIFRAVLSVRNVYDLANTGL